MLLSLLAKRTKQQGISTHKLESSKSDFFFQELISFTRDFYLGGALHWSRYSIFLALFRGILNRPEKGSTRSGGEESDRKPRTSRVLDPRLPSRPL